MVLHIPIVYDDVIQ